MKKKLRRFILEMVLRWLLADEPKRGALTKKNYVVAMSKLYQNPAFVAYLDAREDYLIKQTMNLLVNDKLLDSKAVTGQLLELRTLRAKTKACYDSKRKLTDD